MSNSDYQQKFIQAAKQFYGCDGGDMGSAKKPSIWVCGIEHGGTHTTEQEKEFLDKNWVRPPAGYDTWKEDIAYRYNWNVMKMLSAINGLEVSEYADFAQNVQPFVSGHNGYFKLNLYPIAFRKTAAWNKEFKELIGIDEIDNKNSYVEWCRKNRLPEMNKWALKSQPKLILCTGETYLKAFKLAFASPEVNQHTESIQFESGGKTKAKDLVWFRNKVNSLVAVIPFMSAPNGLQSNDSIQKFGNRIKELLS